METMGCKFCLCPTVKPSKMRVWEYPLLLLLVRPYECTHWAPHRFYRFWPLQLWLDARAEFGVKSKD